MSSENDQIKAAKVVADAARERFRLTTTEARTRLAPKTLARGAMRQVQRSGAAVAQEGVDSARRHPGLLAGILIGLIAIVLRRPLWRWVRKR